MLPELQLGKKTKAAVFLLCRRFPISLWDKRFSGWTVLRLTADFQGSIMELLLEFLYKHLVVGKTVFFRNIEYRIIRCKQIGIGVFQAYTGNVFGERYLKRFFEKAGQICRGYRY